ncbi:MAG: ribonuclease HI family protein [Methanomassiliicoccales archaeon]|nr:ribonuclease HI family protein [Methanomassiliicoccales archaeon]
MESDNIRIHVYTDAGSRGNPGPSAYAIVVCSADGKRLKELARFIGLGTNNEAEYRGVIAALEEGRALGADELEITSDSQLLVRQINRQYRVKAQNLRPMVEEVWQRMTAFKGVDVRHAPREHPMIQRADLLVNQELDMMEFAQKLRKP